eukprot:3940375-Rhodomonas_salina.2
MEGIFRVKEGIFDRISGIFDRISGIFDRISGIFRLKEGPYLEASENQAQLCPFASTDRVSKKHHILAQYRRSYSAIPDLSTGLSVARAKGHTLSEYRTAHSSRVAPYPISRSA